MVPIPGTELLHPRDFEVAEALFLIPDKPLSIALEPVLMGCSGRPQQPQDGDWAPEEWTAQLEGRTSRDGEVVGG